MRRSASNKGLRAAGIAAFCGLLYGAAALAQPAPEIPGDGADKAAVESPAAAGGAIHSVPSFWDPRRRPEQPDLKRPATIRFLTETDYPPFDFAGPDGNPIGFNVDVARMICSELKIACTVQMRRFDTLLSAIAENRGDAVIASIAVTPETRKKVDFTTPYYRTPARFVALKDSPLTDIRPERLEGKKVAVIAGTAHEAYLKTLFKEVTPVTYPNAEAAREALRKKEVDLLFGDGIALAFWLNGTDSQSCCVFRGGPFYSGRFFGEGVGIAVKRGDDQLRQALNWAMFRMWEKGAFTELWLRYFPIDPF